jgi:anti-sigma B factor antagonist
MSPADSTPVEDDEFAVQVHRDAHTTVVAVHGEVDLLTAKQFGAALDQAAREQPEVFVVDLTGLTFLGSLGLSHLVAAKDATGPGVMRVVATGGPRRAIDVTGLDSLFNVVGTVDEALGAHR